MSELELSILRARSFEALKQKARRGELFLTVAVGYVRAGRDRIEQDPDLRVREAIGLVFARFAEMQSIRQVHLSLRSDQIMLPCVTHRQDEGRVLVWKLPVYNTIHHLLTNPVYAGAYAFGRTGSRRPSRMAASGSCEDSAKTGRTGMSCSSIVMPVTFPGQSSRGTSV